MKVLKVTNIEKQKSYDIKTSTENFYVFVDDDCKSLCLVHNSPAVFAGIDPSDGQFFVAKKGIFNKNPKIYKTSQDINNDIAEGDLRTKLNIALKEFSKLGIKGVIQGDLMFTQSTLQNQTIDGTDYIIFQPNTIVYAVPKTQANKILLSNIGVVWHTRYEGNSFENMRASYGTNIVSSLNNVSTVWQMDANYQDVSGVATFTKEETGIITTLLSHTGTIFRTIPRTYFDIFTKNSTINNFVMIYLNSLIKNKSSIDDSRKMAKGFIDWIMARYQKEINSKKTEKSKMKLSEDMKSIIGILMSPGADHLNNIFQLFINLSKAKQVIIDKMSKVGAMSTFLRTTQGFRVTKDEGYVAIDNFGGNAVKLVDRMEFSMANFSPDVLKGWQR